MTTLSTNCWENPVDRGAWWPRVHAVQRGSLAHTHSQPVLLEELFWKRCRWRRHVEEGGRVPGRGIAQTLGGRDLGAPGEAGGYFCSGRQVPRWHTLLLVMGVLPALLLLGDFSQPVSQERRGRFLQQDGWAPPVEQGTAVRPLLPGSDPELLSVPWLTLRRSTTDTVCSVSSDLCSSVSISCPLSAVCPGIHEARSLTAEEWSVRLSILSPFLPPSLTPFSSPSLAQALAVLVAPYTFPEPLLRSQHCQAPGAEE